MNSIISKNNFHSLSHVAGKNSFLHRFLQEKNLFEIFDFSSEIRSVNQIKNTLLKLKQNKESQLKKKFDPNLIDERVRDFHFDRSKNVFYVTLLCGQIFIFTRKTENDCESDLSLKFQITKKVTLKQKILKMEKIEGFRKELVLPEDLSQKFEDQLEAMTTTTTGSRTISLISSKRSSSLMKTRHSQMSHQIRQVNNRCKSLKK